MDGSYALHPKINSVKHLVVSQNTVTDAKSIKLGKATPTLAVVGDWCNYSLQSGNILDNTRKKSATTNLELDCQHRAKCHNQRSAQK